MLLQVYGAELELTPGPQGIEGAVQKAKKLAKSDSTYFMPQPGSTDAPPFRGEPMA
ncbi:cysteine synthase A [Ferrithrix thermotolerans DSM 19514]|uniref:Cysteine synthase A n=1 Tax=Ferrithrix thermotolerans DSM 19514 TaxID=1121881 RepID=A0A1M4Y699_9ACTN|nr:hypothetical protein [Ferrithrix thermotolerans]SHF01199.1 cysteine synthase A [Ferrithrix thermotolerans DSM 19514]